MDRVPWRIRTVVFLIAIAVGPISVAAAPDVAGPGLPPRPLGRTFAASRRPIDESLARPYDRVRLAP